MELVRMLAYVTGMVDQEQLLRNEYFGENRKTYARSEDYRYHPELDARAHGCYVTAAFPLPCQPI